MGGSNHIAPGHETNSDYLGMSLQSYVKKQQQQKNKKKN